MAIIETNIDKRSSDITILFSNQGMCIQLWVQLVGVQQDGGGVQSLGGLGYGQHGLPLLLGHLPHGLPDLSGSYCLFTNSYLGNWRGKL